MWPVTTYLKKNSILNGSYMLFADFGEKSTSPGRRPGRRAAAEQRSRLSSKYVTPSKTKNKTKQAQQKQTQKNNEEASVLETGKRCCAASHGCSADQPNQSHVLEELAIREIGWTALNASIMFLICLFSVQHRRHLDSNMRGILHTVYAVCMVYINFYM